MPTRLRFNAPPHYRLEAGGVVIMGGQSDIVLDSIAQQLLADQHVDVTVIPSNGRKAWPKGHDKLDALAAELNVTWPAPDEGAAALTAADKVSHLEAAGYLPDGHRPDGEALAPDHEGDE